MNSDKKEPNPFLGIQFMNCGTYTRIYRNADKTAYQGMCPSCGVPIKVRIDPGEKGATSARFFKYYNPMCPKNSS